MSTINWADWDEEAFEREESEREIEDLKERIEESYIITKEGKIIRATMEEAHDYASLHLAIGERLFPDVKASDDYMNDIGYISMGSAAYGNRIKHDPSQAQMNTLFKIGIRRIVDDNGNVYTW